jgi:5-methylcytosine-specific restriction protein A
MPYAAPIHRSPQSVRIAEQRIATEAERNRQKGKFYNSAVWRKFRLVCLAAQPLCAHCLTQGLVTVATDCHHIKDRRTHADLILDQSNIENLCHACHSKLTMQEMKSGARS